jgi:hypothetical protein
LLFSAGCPLGERELGIDVPLTFRPLAVGPIVNLQPRPPGHLSPKTVREAGGGLGASICAVPYVRPAAPFSFSDRDVRSRMLESGFSISFQLTKEQGAALVTKYPTYREDIQRERIFKEYTKRHYDSWVAFASEIGHGDDVRPVLVTGADMTRDFAMMAYADNGVSASSEFTTSIPMIGSASASAWGTWRTKGLVHTNCGPQLCRPPSSTQTKDSTPSGNNGAEIIPEYNQCVFVRYYSMRKRALVFPTVIKAAAGPHDLGSGGCDDEGIPEVEAQYGSDSGSDILDADRENDRSSVTELDSGCDTVSLNTISVRYRLRNFTLLILTHSHPTQDERDDFDLVADYIFQVTW